MTEPTRQYDKEISRLKLQVETLSDRVNRQSEMIRNLHDILGGLRDPLREGEAYRIAKLESDSSAPDPKSFDNEMNYLKAIQFQSEAISELTRLINRLLTHSWFKETSSQ